MFSELTRVQHNLLDSCQCIDICTTCISDHQFNLDYSTHLYHLFSVIVCNVEEKGVIAGNLVLITTDIVWELGETECPANLI